MPTDECLEECEILTSIYSEIIIEHGKPNTDESLISMVLYPSTGDDETSRHVTVTLEFILPLKYPEVLPVINFRNPRGLSDVKLDELQLTIIKKSKELIGGSMMFQIRDIVQEFLTSNNRPASECPICLLSFTDFDVFYRPDCFHHYHSRCLGTYLQNVITTFKSLGEQKLPNEKLVLSCPVCRMELDPKTDVEKLLSAPPPAEEELESVDQSSLPENWLGERETLKALYIKQKQQGGIIDLTEKNKKLLMISDTSTSTSPSTTTTPPSTASDSDSRSEPVCTIPSVNENATKTSSSTTISSATTTANITTTSTTGVRNTTTAHSHSYSHRSQHRQATGSPGHKEESSGQSYTVYRHDNDRYGHHTRHRPHHCRGESRTFYNNGYSNHTSGNPVESKPGRNLSTATVTVTPKDFLLTNDGHSQVKFSNTHGHGQCHNRDRRRPK